MSYLNDIKKKSINSMKWQSFNAIITSLINPLFIVLLTKAFTPDHFGVIAILMMIVSFAQKITNLGFSQAIIQKDDVDDKDLNTIFIFIIIMGVLIVTLLNSTAGIIAGIYNEKRLVELIKYTSILFLIQPMGSIYHTILKKELNYNLLTKINLIEFLTQKITILLLAYLGLGLKSYPLGMIIGITVGNLILFILFYKRKIWVPRPEFSINRLKRFFKFGIFLTGQSLVDNLFYYIDEIIISTLFNTEILGVYYFAKNIFSSLTKLVDRTISQVLYPTFCKLQNYDKAFYNLTIKLIKAISAVILPIALGVSLLASLFVPLFFGVEWLASIDMITIMSIWAVFYLSTNVLMGPLYAKGKTNWVFFTGIIEFPIRAVVLYVAGRHGITLFIIALTLVQIFKYLTFLQMTKMIIGLKITKAISEVKYIYISAIIACFISWILKRYISSLFNDLISLLLIGILFVFIYIFLVYLTDKNITKFIAELIPFNKKIGRADHNS